MWHACAASPCSLASSATTPLPTPTRPGLVSLLPATDPGVWRVQGGNARLAPGVLRAANATVRCPAAVSAVRRLPDGRFALELAAGQGQGAEQEGEPFDAVVLATPLEASGIRLEGLADQPFIPARKYLKVRWGGVG